MIETPAQASSYFAAIDLGSNSFHMLVVEMSTGQPREVLRYKQRVRLAAGLDKANTLSDEAIARGISVLETFSAKLSRFAPLTVKTVATHTLRVATNRQQFLDQAAKIFSHPIDVISGQQEAELVYRGVQACEQSKDRTLVIDIGGGSTEIAIGDQQRLLATHSCQMGCITFNEAFFKQNTPLDAFSQADLRARSELSAVAEQFKRIGWDQVRVTSGTGDVMHKVAQRSGSLNGIDVATLTQVKAAFLLAEHADQTITLDKLLNGVSEHRRSLLPAGITILTAVLDELGVQHARYSPAALRDGLLALNDRLK